MTTIFGLMRYQHHMRIGDCACRKKWTKQRVGECVLGAFCWLARVAPRLRKSLAWHGKRYIHGRRCSMKAASMHCAPSVEKEDRRNWTHASWRNCGAACSTVQPRMASAPSCGHSSGCACSLKECSLCHTAKCMSGAFSGHWALATRSRNAAPSSAMKMPCKNSKARPGPRSKKSPERKAADCLHRRIWIERTPHARQDLGAERANAGDSISLQLETLVGDCRVEPNELPVPLS